MKILPGTGRGTAQGAVEGRCHMWLAQPQCPSTACGGPPPHKWGGFLA